MISLNDYLYSGNTVLKILHQYEADLREHAKEVHNPIDLVHSNFLLQLTSILEHSTHLVDQSARLLEFYKLMAKNYPHLAFTFRGRIKSLIRAESKFNRYVIDFVSDYYEEHGEMPPMSDLKQKLSFFRDLIAYRFVISLPKCHLKEGQDQENEEIRYLYEIANAIPFFLEERGFSPVIVNSGEYDSPLDPTFRPYFKDFVANPSSFGYRSLHITFFDNIGNSYTEIQIRTKKMDDYATIGPANHLGYEKRQLKAQSRRDRIPYGLSTAFDEAWERQNLLQHLDLSKIDVNMFSAYSADLINDGCGLYRGRLITPYEHLSRFQNDPLD